MFRPSENIFDADRKLCRRTLCRSIPDKRIPLRNLDHPERQLQPSGAAQSHINLRWCGNFEEISEKGGIEAMRLPAALCKTQRKKRETDEFSKSTLMTPPGSHPTSGFGTRHGLPRFFRYKKRRIVQKRCESIPGRHSYWLGPAG